MDIQEIISKVMEELHNAPEKLEELAKDPKAAIESIIGEGKLGDVDPSEVLKGIQEKLGDVDVSAISEEAMDKIKGVVGEAETEGEGILEKVHSFIEGILGK